MSGLLHGLNGKQPADSLAAVLRPALWRVGSFGAYQRAAALGARVQLVLSDGWGYPSSRYGWPYENYAAWEGYVRETARKYAGSGVIWDIWNEPDYAMFWGGSEEQFRETYRRAAAVLRSELGPEAVIGGPSYASNDVQKMKRFLDFCVAAGCPVNVLSWHELDWDIVGVERRLREMRSIMARPEYAGLGLRELHVNEVVGSASTQNPGDILGWLYYLERGGADAAAKSCWPNAAGENSCFNGSLGGLLSESLQPTGAWWALKSYADGADSRVSSTSDSPLLVALASSAAAGYAQVLLNFAGDATEPASVTLKLQGLDQLTVLDGKKSIRVRQYRIPATGEAALSSLPLLSDSRILAKNGGATLSLAGLAPHESILILLSQ